jgi:pyrimidine-nucleoside phosphorylase
VHIRADETWAPADAALFRLRQQEGTQAVPALAIASILSKKIAAGVGVAGLEARIARFGNFGASIEEGRRNSMLYCRVAAELGLDPVVILTDARIPFQAYIGRGEALTALWKVANDDLADEPWLAEHAQLCASMTAAVVNRSSVTAPGGTLARPRPLDVLTAHLTAQGTSTIELTRRVQETADQRRRTLAADADGFVHYDLGRIRGAIGTLAQPDTPSIPVDGKADFDDPAGVRLLCRPGRRVRRGEPLIELRSRSMWPDRLASGLFEILDSSGPATNTIMEVISR